MLSEDMRLDFHIVSFDSSNARKERSVLGQQSVPLVSCCLWHTWRRRRVRCWLLCICFYLSDLHSGAFWYKSSCTTILLLPAIFAGYFCLRKLLNANPASRIYLVILWCQKSFFAISLLPPANDLICDCRKSISWYKSGDIHTANPSWRLWKKATDLDTWDGTCSVIACLFFICAIKHRRLRFQSNILSEPGYRCDKIFSTFLFIRLTVMHERIENVLGYQSILFVNCRL